MQHASIDKKKLQEEKKKLRAMAKLAATPEFKVLEEYVELR